MTADDFFRGLLVAGSDLGEIGAVIADGNLDGAARVIGSLEGGRITQGGQQSGGVR